MNQESGPKIALISGAALFGVALVAVVLSRTRQPDQAVPDRVEQARTKREQVVKNRIQELVAQEERSAADERKVKRVSFDQPQPEKLPPARQTAFDLLIEDGPDTILTAEGNSDRWNLFSGEIEITLSCAACPASVAGGPKDLTLYLHCDDGKWRRDVWGYAPGYNHADHEGLLLSVAQDGRTLRFTVDMSVNQAPWDYHLKGRDFLPSDAALYRVELKTQGTRVEGEYAGAYMARLVKGAVRGTVRTTWPARVADHVPVATGEHPRLVIRKKDVPALRSRAKTAPGKVFYDRLAAEAAKEGSRASPVAQAAMYLLTGDAGYVRKCLPFLQQIVANSAGSYPQEQARDRITVALVYDLCYDALDDALRAEVTAFLDREADRLYTEATTCRFYSSWSGILLGAAGMSSLAVLKEPGPHPNTPFTPDIETLSAPTDFDPGSDVPIFRLPSGAPLVDWLCAGPFPVATTEDLLAGIGGRDKARPVKGTKVAHGDKVLEFQPVDKRHVVETPGTLKIDLLSLTGKGRDADSTCYFYGSLQADVRVVVKAAISFQGAMMWIAGTPVRGDVALRLDPGKYPVMLQVPVSSKSPYVKLMKDVSLEVKISNEYDYSRQGAPARMYRRMGGLRPMPDILSKYCELGLKRWLSSAQGEHGWNIDRGTDAGDALRYMLPFLHAHRNVTGRDLSAVSNVEWILPLAVARSVPEWDGYGRFGDRGDPPDIEHFTYGLGTVQAKHRPAVLWYYERLSGIRQGRLDVDRAASHYTLGPAVQALFGLVNYSGDDTARNPADVLPRFTADEDRGGYVFRNQWTGGDDIVASIDAKREPLFSVFPNAASFRILGLGNSWADRGPVAEWAARPPVRRPAPRYFENVLWLPGATPVRGATPTHVESSPDGSGVVSMNMDNLYTLSPDGDLTDAYATVAPHKARDTGVRGIRSFAVDYSGKAGVPALFVVVDSIDGADARDAVWLMHAGTGRASSNGRTFTIAADRGASLKGTFAAPADVRFVEHPAVKADGWPSPIRAVCASGGSQYFVVMTLQSGAAPEVGISGSGLDATVTVGQQTVRFDGKKIVFGK